MNKKAQNISTSNILVNLTLFIVDDEIHHLETCLSKNLNFLAQYWANLWIILSFKAINTRCMTLCIRQKAYIHLVLKMDF